MAQCRYCPAQIDWVEMDGGAKMPIDREPRPTWCPMPGEMIIVKVVGKRPFAVKAPVDEPLIKVARSHFATCPGADQAREEAKARRAGGP
jgi:hypothetical protein